MFPHVRPGGSYILVGLAAQIFIDYGFYLNYMYTCICISQVCVTIFRNLVIQSINNQYL